MLFQAEYEYVVRGVVSVRPHWWQRLLGLKRYIPSSDYKDVSFKCKDLEDAVVQLKGMRYPIDCASMQHLYIYKIG